MNLIQQNIQKLRDDLHRHNHNYYVLDKPVISDFEFDSKLKELKILEDKFPQFNDENSPTKRVGGTVMKSFDSVIHQYPMYSLNNSYSKQDLEDWNQRLIRNLETENINFLCELKFDGVSINLTYENGNLIKAVTRGDGMQGDDVTENIKTIKTIPLKLKGSFPEKFQIRGEIIINKHDFAEMNNKRFVEDLEPYMNPRNTASGSLKLRDSSETAKRPLKCFFYQVVTEKNDIKTQKEYLTRALGWGFKISNTYRLCDNLAEVMSFINNWDKERSRLDFEIDGVVIKVNNIKFQKQLGFTSKYPRWSIAYKFKTEQVSTKLLGVSYQLGRTGAVTPVANLESVLLGGTYVRRASLHNQDQINKLDLYFNDHVFIEKGGEIIPKIVGVEFEKRDFSSKKIKFIKNCPSCNHVLIRNESESHHYCLNTDNCAPQIIGRIQHFISRKAMDINGIGNETIDLLYKSGLILNYADLYDLKKENLIVLERMAEKSVDNIYSGLEESKKISFERVLFSLGIRYVGQTVAKKLAKEFKSIDNLISKTYEDLLLIDEIGERISRSIIDFFNIKNNVELINRLRSFGLQFEITETDRGLNYVLSEYRFVISGIFEINSRDELKKIIEDHGGKVSSSITSKTSYLVGGNNIGPSKLIKANSLGISIISEKELNYLIKSKL